ncbi:MAG TPA: alpha-amylase family glycosyl hydrolase, partial [Acidobacteriota bacterium]|nr:alpha-amylase family glycosyl hydrolase [Acidobacteriota bacterium]
MSCSSGLGGLVIQGKKREGSYLIKRELGYSSLFSYLLICIVACLLAISCTHKEQQPPVATQPEQPAAAATPESIPQPAPQGQQSWADAVLYFAIVDRFADGDSSNNRDVDITQKGTFHGGDIKGLIRTLDQIAELGVTAIWITPVIKNIDDFVTGAGFPDWGYHGYWADDFYKTDFRFGMEEDIKTLADECHKRGIKLLLDVVYNHCGYDSQYTKNPATKNWLRTEQVGTCGQDDLTSCLSGLPDFKTELPEVADYLMKAHLGMAKRTGIDGFRLDTVKHVDHPFWKEHRQRTRNELDKDFFLLGEVWGGDPKVLDEWFEGDEMDAGFDFSFQGSVTSFLLGRGRTIAFDRYLKTREQIRPGYLVSHFLSSHDVTGALKQLDNNVDLFRLAAILQMTSAGIPMIYYGEEVARPGGDWPDNRSDMPWGSMDILPGKGKPRDEKLRADYIKLVHIRRAHLALSRGAYGSISSEGDLLVFSRSHSENGDVVVVAVNRGTAPANASFALPAEWNGKQIKDVWNGEAATLNGTNINMEL